MTHQPPRVLVEPSDYVLRNLGDMAMLRAAVERIGVVLPGASIQVLTDEPDALRDLCPSATPLRGTTRHLWAREGFLDRLLRKLEPASGSGTLRRHIPSGIAKSLEHYLSHRSRFVRSVKQADLLVVAGMGGITDYFRDYAFGVLRSVELAIDCGTRVAMIGQGIGPIADPELRAKAASVLLKVDLIGLREKRASGPLLRSLGVDPRRICVTGDDAVETAYALRSGEIGDGVGLNLRVSSYSGAEASDARAIGEAVRELAAAKGAPIVPLPVSRVAGEADLDTLRAMIPDEGQELARAEQITSPDALVGQIQRCRLVVTGSYHAGVFALASGIPTIGVAASSYYVDKFEGLADMFGEGCEVVTLGGRDWAQDFKRAAEHLWSSADAVRPHLLEAAQGQIRLNRDAYGRIAGLLA